MTPPYLDYALPDLQATAALAGKLARHLQAGDFLALEGALGAGKTAFARALLQKWGVDGDIPSPTFTLVQQYDAPDFAVSHFDLYRLKKAEELEELGWDDALTDSVTLVEWPERAAAYLPGRRLILHFALNDTGQRRVRLTPMGAWPWFKEIK